MLGFVLHGIIIALVLVGVALALLTYLEVSKAEGQPVSVALVPSGSGAQLSNGKFVDEALVDMADFGSASVVVSDDPAVLAQQDVVFGLLPTDQLAEIQSHTQGLILSTWSTAGVAGDNMFRLSNMDGNVRYFWKDVLAGFAGKPIHVVYDREDVWSDALATILGEEDPSLSLEPQNPSSLSSDDAYIVLRRDFVDVFSGGANGSGAMLMFGDFAAYDPEVEALASMYDVYAVTSNPAGDDDMILAANLLRRQVPPAAAALLRCASIIQSLEKGPGMRKQFLDRFGPSGMQWFADSGDAFAQSLQVLKFVNDEWQRVVSFDAVRKLRPLQEEEGGSMALQIQAVLPVGPADQVPPGTLGSILEKPVSASDTTVHMAGYSYRLVKSDMTGLTWVVKIECENSSTGELNKWEVVTDISVHTHIEAKLMFSETRTGVRFYIVVEETNATSAILYTLTTAEIIQIRSSEFSSTQSGTTIPLMVQT